MCSLLHLEMNYFYYFYYFNYNWLQQFMFMIKTLAKY